MRFATLFKVMLVVVAIWLWFVLPHVFNAGVLLSNADGFGEAELVVEDVACTGMSEGRHRKRGQCSIDGTVYGDRVSLSIRWAPERLPYDKDMLLERFPPGTAIKVLYNPAHPDSDLTFGDNRVQWWEKDLAAEMRWRLLGFSKLLLLTLGSVVTLFVAVRIGISRRSLTTPEVIELDVPKPWQGFGLLVGGFGLALVIAQVPRPAAGGLVFGVLFSGLGAMLLLRGWVRVERSGYRLTCGRHLFGHVFPKSVLEAEDPRKVLLTKERNVLTVVSVSAGNGALMIGKLTDSGKPIELAQQLARALTCNMVDETKVENT